MYIYICMYVCMYIYIYIYIDTGVCEQTHSFYIKQVFTLLDLRASSLRRGHANLLCIVPTFTDDPRRESVQKHSF